MSENIAVSRQVKNGESAGRQKLKNVTTSVSDVFDRLDGKNSPRLRRFYDIVFLIGFACCFVPGPLPSLVTPASILLVLCILVSIFDSNFYMYAALFIYMRYKMMIGATPAFRFYTYLAVLKFMTGILKTKFRVMYFPAIFVFFLHCVLAVPQIDSLRIGMNTFVDCTIIYFILLELVADENLLRRFLTAFLMGCVTSGVYGRTSSDAIHEFNVAGAGVEKVARNFGALSDSNFAGMIYSLCIITSVTVKNIPKILRLLFLGVALVLLMQTISLSAMITLIAMLCMLLVLKYRGKSVFMMFLVFVLIIFAVTILMSVPQFKEIKAISGLIVRLEEKISYITRGRWDLLTTGRTEIWEKLMPYLKNESLWRKMVGGNVNTVYSIDRSIIGGACHNSYIQSYLNFGLIGTLLIYVPFFTANLYKLYVHFSKKPGYEGEDVQIMRMIFAATFVVFGMTVDFFVDWPFMLLYFI